MKTLMSFWKDEDGLTSVEYALLLALVAVAGIVAWGALGSGISDKVENVTTNIESGT